MANPQDEWQSIIDFRAGISANLSPNHPPGTATTNTSGCYARDGAYLTPMPKINKTYYVDEPPASPEEPLNGQFNICGFRAVGPLYFEGPSEISSHKEVTNTELFFAVNWWSNPTTGIDRLNHQVMRYTRHYSNSPVWQTVWGPTRLPAYHDVPSWKGLWLRRNPGVATFAVQRSNPTDQLSYGPTVLTWAFNGMARMFPKDDSLAATNVDDTESVAGDGSDNSGRYPLGVYSHQGRIIVAQLDKPRWLGTKSFWVSTEAIYWTEQNNLSVLAAEFGGDYFKVAIAAGSEAYGYTAVIPVSASELILLRPRDGAVLMQGNLNDFNAITLPYLKGTGINFNAALSAKGLVYTSQGAGMWLWQGGDVSEYVSPGMDPNFWMVRRRLVCQGDDDTEIEWDNWMGQADSWGDWTMFSNNWVWDSVTGAFWRICDPDEAEILRWSVDYQQMRAYGTPTGFRHAGDPICYEFHRTIPRDDYIWESQPIPGSIERMKEVRQVVITTVGEGRVKVRVFSAQDSRGQELVFDTTGRAQPAVQRQNCGVKGSHIQFEIISEADVTTDEEGNGAPQVHGLAFAWRDSAHVSANPQ